MAITNGTAAHDLKPPPEDFGERYAISAEIFGRLGHDCDREQWASAWNSRGFHPPPGRSFAGHQRRYREENRQDALGFRVPPPEQASAASPVAPAS